MKKTLSFMVMALALLLTQCRKPEVKFPSPVAPEGTTVSMTVTAGPGSKTDITTAGGITWSTGDKLYVGDGTHYVGCLTIVSGQNTPTGTFSGDVTLTDASDGEKTFHFFYLGNAKDYSTELKKGTSATVDVSFAEQNIYKNGDKLQNASAQHVGYGSAKGTIANGVVTGINVTLVSKVALAHFSFKKGGTGYSKALTLSGTHIYNKMKVNFNASGFDFSGTKGDIALGSGNAERYVMLVPVGIGSETLSFAGDGFEGSTTLGNGIEPNKFYGREVAIEVKPTPKFTVDDDGTTVEFAPGNLWYGKADGEETAAFHFEANQWGFEDSWNSSHVSHFYWSKTVSVAYAQDYSESGTTTSDVFFTNGQSFQVAGEMPGTWRTLSEAEWEHLLSGRDNASNLRAWKELDSGAHKGLVILPDGTDASVMESITSTSHLATSGAVFLPAAGYRDGTSLGNAGSYGLYWSSSPLVYDVGFAMRMDFDDGWANTNPVTRGYGYAVRCVRAAL